MKKQIPKDETKTSTHLSEKKKRFSVLQIILTIYGLLYLLFMYPGPLDEYNLFELENIIVNLAFVLFLIGYYITWKNERVAGIIFIFWYTIMWYLSLFISEQDPGVAIVFGFPLFILGISFIISWYRKKGKETTA